MAKTKQDYIVEGAKLFKDGSLQPEGNSWQAKAMQEGWDNEFVMDDTNDAYPDVNSNCDLEIWNDPEKSLNYSESELYEDAEASERVWKENQKKKAMHPALMHIELLLEDFNKENTSWRQMRLAHKIMKLKNKRTHLVFSTMEDKKKAENFLLALKLNFQGIIRKPVLTIAPSKYLKHYLDLYLPAHIAGTSFNYKP